MLILCQPHAHSHTACMEEAGTMEVTVVGYLERCMCWGPFSTLLSRDVAPTLRGEEARDRWQLRLPQQYANIKWDTNTSLGEEK